MEEKQLTNREWQASRDKRKVFDLIVNANTYKCCSFREDIFIYRNDESQETEEFNYNVLLDLELEMDELLKDHKWNSIEEYVRVRVFPQYYISKELAGVNKDFDLRLERMIYIFLAFFPYKINIEKEVESIENIKKNSNEVYNDISRFFEFNIDGNKPLSLSTMEVKRILKEACDMDISVSDIETYCQELNIKTRKDGDLFKDDIKHPFLDNNQN